MNSLIATNKEIGVQQVITPYEKLQEYYVIEILDVNNNLHRVDNTEPHPYNSSYDNYIVGDKRYYECKKADIMIRTVANYICSMSKDCKSLIYTIDDINIINVKEVHCYLIKSYYPPTLIDAPYISKKLEITKEFYDSNMLLSAKVKGDNNYA